MNRKTLLSCLIAAAASGAGFNAAASFVDDTKLNLELRNMYIDREMEDANRDLSEWAQGFTWRLNSGFTEGVVGFGVDAIAQLGVKLDSSPDRAGTGLLPNSPGDGAPDSFSELGVALKARVSNTTLAVGTVQPRLPVVSINDVRLLSSTYTGATLNSREIAGLDLNAVYLTEVNRRDSSNRQDITSSAGVASDSFAALGGSYAFTKELTGSYYYAQMEDVYKQHHVGLLHNTSLSDGVRLRTDLRYFSTGEHGSYNGSKIDNDFFNGMVTVSASGHSLGLGYQNLSGDGRFQYPELDPYNVNLSTFHPFDTEEMDAWQLRYDYNFASFGVPGLSFMTRYLKAENIKLGAVTDGTQWERDTDIVYVVQSGGLKGLDLRLRNATFRQGNGLEAPGAVNEWRVIVGYKMDLL